MITKIKLLSIGAACIAAMNIAVASDAGYCGVESAPYDKAYEISDFIDHLPPMSPDLHISDPFFLLANEVGYREELGLPITSDDLVESCSEDFNPLTGGIAYNLVYLNYADNWSQILQAYKKKYGNHYPEIRDALNKMKDQATKYAEANNILINPISIIPTSGTIGEVVPIISLVSISDTEATVHAENGKNFSLSVYDVDTGKPVEASDILNDNVTIAFPQLKPGHSYESVLLDQHQNKAVTIPFTTTNAAETKPSEDTEAPRHTEALSILKAIAECAVTAIKKLSLLFKEGPLVEQLTKQFSGKVVNVAGRKLRIDKFLRVLPNMHKKAEHLEKSTVIMSTGTAITKDVVTGEDQKVVVDLILVVLKLTPEGCAATTVFELGELTVYSE
jgi:hypothetical protein